LIDAEALRIAYDNEVYMDDFGQPRSAFLLLCYIPFAKTFLSYRKVTNIEAAQRVVENQPAPHHDIRFMAGFSLKNLLPPHPIQRQRLPPLMTILLGRGRPLNGALRLSLRPGLRHQLHPTRPL
jgi:hypothetical protein